MRLPVPLAVWDGGQQLSRVLHLHVEFREQTFTDRHSSGDSITLPTLMNGGSDAFAVNGFNCFQGGRGKGCEIRSQAVIPDLLGSFPARNGTAYCRERQYPLQCKLRHAHARWNERL